MMVELVRVRLREVVVQGRRLLRRIHNVTNYVDRYGIL